MQPQEPPCHERIVKIVETCEGVVARTFYCIQDPQFGHWMSEEPFDGLIWTKDPRCRREFASRVDRTAVRFRICVSHWSRTCRRRRAAGRIRIPVLEGAL